MLKNEFNPKLPYRAAAYLRMSSDAQNPRSPDQQLDEIRRRLATLGYSWEVIKTYRDDAKSGRYLSKRPDFQQMLRDVKSGAIAVDLILVDTIERFGRVDELPAIRKNLSEKHGVLVLTADSNFADPQTPQGRALGAFEAMRATEDSRIKAHNVLRGKRDAARRKHWPGGEPPLGYKLQSIMTSVNGREEVDYCILVPNPETRYIVELLFEQAELTSWGSVRLARWLDAHPEIPANFKPFHPSTVGHWLDNPVFYGELRWEAHSTGIVDDARVVVRNCDEEVLRVPDFCEAIVARERWDRVQAPRAVRRKRYAGARRRKEASHGKRILPTSPGLTVNYVLSGLLYCGACGLRLTASSASEYTTKDGEVRRYTSYVCPGYLARHCENGTRVPEPWIRRVVVNKLCERLFPR